MQANQGQDPTQDAKKDKVTPLNQDSVDALLKYLIYIVLHEDDQSKDNDKMKESMLDLLKKDE